MDMLLATLQSSPIVAELFGERELHDLVAAILYSVLGVLLFALVWLLLVKISPFSIRKEIEDDQNTALGIILGAVIIGVSLIISAAVGG
jgi:uncharacterized membrane protein YjfL (UPF0719 family)